MSKDLKKLNELEAQLKSPWELNGECAEDFIKRTTEGLQVLSDILSARTTDTSMVQSTLKDTADLVTYMSARKELTSLKSLLLSYSARENRHGTNNTEGAN